MIDVQNLTQRGVPVELAKQFVDIWNQKGCKTDADRQIWRQVQKILDDNHDYTQYPESEYLKVGADKNRARLCGQAFRGFNEFIPGHHPKNTAITELTERLEKEQERRDFGYELPRIQ